MNAATATHTPSDMILDAGDYLVELAFARPCDPEVLRRALAAMGWENVIFDEGASKPASSATSIGAGDMISAAAAAARAALSSSSQGGPCPGGAAMVPPSGSSIDRRWRCPPAPVKTLGRVAVLGPAERVALAATGNAIAQSRPDIADARNKLMGSAPQREWGISAQRGFDIGIALGFGPRTPWDDTQVRATLNPADGTQQGFDAAIFFVRNPPAAAAAPGVVRSLGRGAPSTAFTTVAKPSGISTVTPVKALGRVVITPAPVDAAARVQLTDVGNAIAMRNPDIKAFRDTIPDDWATRRGFDIGIALGYGPRTPWDDSQVRAGLNAADGTVRGFDQAIQLRRSPAGESIYRGLSVFTPSTTTPGGPLPPPGDLLPPPSPPSTDDLLPPPTPPSPPAIPIDRGGGGGGGGGGGQPSEDAYPQAAPPGEEAAPEPSPERAAAEQLAPTAPLAPSTVPEDPLAVLVRALQNLSPGQAPPSEALPNETMDIRTLRLQNLWRRWNEWGSPFATNPSGGLDALAMSKVQIAGVDDGDDGTRVRFLGRLNHRIRLSNPPGMWWVAIKRLSLHYDDGIRIHVQPHRLDPGHFYEFRFLSRDKSAPTREVVRQRLGEMGWAPMKLSLLKRNIRLPNRPSSLSMWYGMGQWLHPSTVVTVEDPFYFEQVEEATP